MVGQSILYMSQWCNDDIIIILVAGVINVLLRQLEVKRQGNYVSPRVIQGIFNYFVESWVQN